MSIFESNWKDSWVWHTHTTVLLLFWNMSGTTWVSRYQKGKTRKVKTNLHLLEQETVSGSGKSTPHPRQPCQHPTTQFFTGRMPFLPSNQQRQSTEGCSWVWIELNSIKRFPLNRAALLATTITPVLWRSHTYQSQHCRHIRITWPLSKHSGQRVDVPAARLCVAEWTKT